MDNRVDVPPGTPEATEREEQAVWFSVDPEGLVIILHSDGRDVSAQAGEFGLKTYIEIPTEPGVYIWEGTVEGHGPVMSDPPQDAHSWWEGETRVCGREDIESLALSLCLERAEAGKTIEVLLSHLIEIGRVVAAGEDLGEDRPFEKVVALVRGLGEAWSDGCVALAAIGAAVGADVGPVSAGSPGTLPAIVDRAVALREERDRLRALVAASERFRVKDALDHMEDLNYFRRGAARVVAGLLDAAYPEWETHVNGDGWRDALAAGRRFVALHGRPTDDVAADAARVARDRRLAERVANDCGLTVAAAERALARVRYWERTEAEPDERYQIEAETKADGETARLVESFGEVRDGE